jgi:hypothetical protein
MAQLYEILPRATRLELVLRAQGPARLARTFAQFAGQFYCRKEFDSLARQVSDLYDLQNPKRAGFFRSQLDRRLCEHDHQPVRWDVDTPHEEYAA